LPVAGADGYSLRFATDPELTQYVSSTVAATITGMTRTGLLPNTKYYVMIRANAASPDVASNYSVPIEVTTPSESQTGMVGDLEQWLNVMENMKTLYFKSFIDVDQILLSPSDRRRSLGSGVRRYGFVDQVSDIAAAYPQFWPAYTTNPERLKELIREIEVLRNLIVFQESCLRETTDLLLIAGHEAFQMANRFYASVQRAARQQIPDAEAVYKMIRLFWRRRRRNNDEPTEQEAERDFKAVLRGTKTGNVGAQRTADRVTQGELTVVDETQNARQRGGVKVDERDELE